MFGYLALTSRTSSHGRARWEFSLCTTADDGRDISHVISDSLLQALLKVHENAADVLLRDFMNTTPSKLSQHLNSAWSLSLKYSICPCMQSTEGNILITASYITKRGYCFMSWLFPPQNLLRSRPIWIWKLHRLLPFWELKNCPGKLVLTDRAKIWWLTTILGNTSSSLHCTCSIYTMVESETM